MTGTYLKDKLRRNTISKTIISRITEALIQGELKPGDRLPTDTELAQMMGVGRNSVREALKIMEAFGILEIRRSEGIYITSGYSRGLIDPLLYGAILDGAENEEAGNVYRAFLQTLLLMDIPYVTAEDLKALASMEEKLERLVQSGCSEEKIYPIISELDAYFGRISGNRIAEDVRTVLEKLCRRSRLSELKQILEAGEGERIIRRYQKIRNLLAMKDETGIMRVCNDNLDM